MNEDRQEAIDRLVKAMSRESAVVSGRVVELANGKPIAGATVQCQFCRVVTDPWGYYRLPAADPGSMTVKFSRPHDRSGSGPVLERQVQLSAGDAVRMDIALDMRGASDPPYDWIEGEFAGIYHRGLEWSEFEPEGRTIQDSQGQTRVVNNVWVEFHFNEPSSNPNFGSYRVRWRGIVAGPGFYGHMDSSDHLMVVQEILMMESLAS